MEQMKKVQEENNLLLERIEELEMGKEGIPTKMVHSSSFCELLLRIDTMVISGMIGTAEASDLRKKVMDNRNVIHSTFSNIHHKTNAGLLSELRRFSKQTTEKPLHALHSCTEMDPVASCGSLASYVTGLSCAVQRMGNLVEVILPKYKGLNVDAIQGLRKAEAEFDSYFGGCWHKNKVWTGVASGIGLTLVGPLHSASFFNRDMLYGYSDDFERDLVALEYC